MAKLVLNDVTSGSGSETVINANSAAIEAEFDNTVSRDGSSPNAMTAALDMNSQRIINLPTAVNNTDPIILSQAASIAGTDNPISQQIVGQNLYPRSADEITASAATDNTLYYYPYGDIRRYGATEAAADNSTEIQEAIDVAELGGAEVFVPEGVWLYTTKLVHDGTLPITVRGVNSGYFNKNSGSILRKNADIIGLEITGGSHSTFIDFSLDSVFADSSVGIKGTSVGQARFIRLSVEDHGSHGIELNDNTGAGTSNYSSFSDIITRNNGGDGIKLHGGATPVVNGIVFNNVEARDNTGYGVNIKNAWFAMGNITANSNTAGGVSLDNAQQCLLTVNGVSNTTSDLEFTNNAACKGNIVNLIDGLLLDSSTQSSTLGNLVYSTMSGTTFVPSFNRVKTETLELLDKSQLAADDAAGRLILDHSAANVFNFTASGTAGHQTLNFLNSNASGNLHVLFDGAVTYNGTPQEITGAGAVDIVNAVTHLITTAADAYTLVDGAEGQHKFIVMETDGGVGTLTPTNLANGTTIAFRDINDSAYLFFSDGNWNMIGGTAQLANVSTYAGGAGALPITAPTCQVTTTGADALTLADGVEGQEITLTLVAQGGAGTVTPASPASNYATLILTDVGDTVSLLFTNSTWVVKGSFEITSS